MRFVPALLVAASLASSSLSLLSPSAVRSDTLAAREEREPDREGPTGPGEPSPSDGKEGRAHGK